MDYDQLQINPIPPLIVLWPRLSEIAPSWPEILPGVFLGLGTVLAIEK